ncbi:hypothetical protein [Camelimonas abortus]|uniref:hypothetical protein n=1 Tax=Camelimonas abortus TaxID=1017184 RepID=UPI0036712E97
MTLQFEPGLCQKDVITKWAPTLPGAKDGVNDGNMRRRWRLIRDQIGRHFVFRKPASKSNGEEWAEHDL